MLPAQTSTPVAPTPVVSAPRRHLPPPAGLVGVLFVAIKLREDELCDLAIGATVPIRSSSSAEAVGAKRVELRNLGGFAVWRTARATGDHDRNTVFLHLAPVALTTDARPGQTMWLAR